ncbi:hypothetical protein [Verminephrobacter eiseniae]|nr:hypothetical protein [Verminephrobacter eiseniae]
MHIRPASASWLNMVERFFRSIIATLAPVALPQAKRRTIRRARSR